MEMKVCVSSSFIQYNFHICSECFTAHFNVNLGIGDRAHVVRREGGGDSLFACATHAPICWLVFCF